LPEQVRAMKEQGLPAGAGTSKLRLNAEQWSVLQRLARDGACAAGDRPIAASWRLTSHGLVATDRKGCAYVTLSGWHRLRQGR